MRFLTDAEPTLGWDSGVGSQLLESIARKRRPLVSPCTSER